jgi:NAD(P)-dependent dehydrogenase (short-subunit alcohol dehydrogenase family)
MRLAYGAGVKEAIEARRGVVALESTVIAHGLPRPRNLETALLLERDVRDAGAVPATICLADGMLIVGAPDALVITPAINVRKRASALTDDDVRRVFELNLVGTFRLMRDFGQAMADSGRGGSIVVFSSIRAQVVEPGQSIYAATKAGALQLARTLASELGPSGVRVNAVAPGVVETPLTAQIKNNPEWYAAYAAKSALGRWAKPSEMVGAVIFLCSDAGSYVTGSYLVVDGGWLAQDGRFTPPL